VNQWARKEYLYNDLLWAGWSGGQTLAGARGFVFSVSVQTALRITQPRCQLVLGFFPGE